MSKGEKVEKIPFLHGELPQYPECVYAQPRDDGARWGIDQIPEGRFQVIHCEHPDVRYKLCVTNHELRQCPIGKEPVKKVADISIFYPVLYGVLAGANLTMVSTTAVLDHRLNSFSLIATIAIWCMGLYIIHKQRGETKGWLKWVKYIWVQQTPSL